MSCGVGHRLGSDPALLWLWHRPVAIAPIWPFAWEPPYVAGAALKRQTNKQIKWLTKKRCIMLGITFGKKKAGKWAMNFKLFQNICENGILSKEDIVKVDPLKHLPERTKGSFEACKSYSWLKSLGWSSKTKYPKNNKNTKILKPNSLCGVLLIFKK